MKKFFILISFFVFTNCSTPSQKKETKQETTELMKQVYALAVQGDVQSAIGKLNSVPNHKLTVEEKELKEKYVSRFISGEKAFISEKDIFAKDLVSSYHEYWNVALMEPDTPEKHYKLLFDKLNSVTQIHFNKNFGRYSQETAEDMVQFIKEQMAKRGYQGIYGRTIPHLDLMLWAKQTERDYLAQLPQGPTKVKVVLLDEFLTHGWSNYATFGYSGTGGWAEKDKLYCVAPSYDLTSESFKVSYLAHEGQHFSDYKKFPQLEQPELEYRAKLTELALAQETSLDLIEKFRTGGKKSRNSPHAFANFNVYQNLKSEIFGSSKPNWQIVSPTEVQAAAVRLLNQNTQELVKNGASRIKRIL